MVTIESKTWLPWHSDIVKRFMTFSSSMQSSNQVKRIFGDYYKVERTSSPNRRINTA